MTDDELIEAGGRAIYERDMLGGPNKSNWEDLIPLGRDVYCDLFRAALAVAEPVIGEKLRAERDAALAMAEKLAEALRPFAVLAAMAADGFPDTDIAPFRLGECRKARAALAVAEPVIRERCAAIRKDVAP